MLDYLFHSRKEEINQKDVERALSLKNPTVTGAFETPGREGLHPDRPQRKDRRCKKIYLTEKAYDIRRRMEADRKKVDKRLTIGMTKKEVQALRKMLDKVLYNVADP